MTAIRATLLREYEHPRLLDLADTVVRYYAARPVETRNFDALEDKRSCLIIPHTNSSPLWIGHRYWVDRTLQVLPVHAQEHTPERSASRLRGSRYSPTSKPRLWPVDRIVYMAASEM
jgi:hypothetical protein